MADEHKGISLVILGVVAIIAIVGLVLMFVRNNAVTGEGVYGGAIKQVAYPDWVGRGTPANRPGEEALWPSTASKDVSTHWNYYGSAKRDPLTDVPSALTKWGGNGFLVSYDNVFAYDTRGYVTIETEDKAGVCVYPQEDMVGGIAK